MIQKCSHSNTGADLRCMSFLNMTWFYVYFKIISTCLPTWTIMEDIVEMTNLGSYWKHKLAVPRPFIRHSVDIRMIQIVMDRNLYLQSWTTKQCLLQGGIAKSNAKQVPFNWIVWFYCYISLNCFFPFNLISETTTVVVILLSVSVQGVPYLSPYGSGDRHQPPTTLIKHKQKRMDG